MYNSKIRESTTDLQLHLQVAIELFLRTPARGDGVCVCGKREKGGGGQNDERSAHLIH